MLDRTVELVYNVTGQTVETYPPRAVEDGVPTSATCSVFEGMDSNDDTAEFSPSVTIDSVSTTCDAASGYAQSNRRKVNLTATTNIVIGRQYLMENADSQREVVTPVRIVSGDYVELDEDLQYDYAATTGTFKGLRMVWTVDATWVADETNVLYPWEPSYRARWQFTQNLITRHHWTYLRLVRKDFKLRVNVHDLQKFWPDVVFNEPNSARGQQYRWALENGYNALRIDLRNAKLRPEQLNDTETVDRLILLKALQLLGQFGIVPGNREAELYIQEMRKEYETLLNNSIRASLNVEVDDGVEGNTSANPIQQPWFDR